MKRISFFLPPVLVIVTSLTPLLGVPIRGGILIGGALVGVSGCSTSTPADEPKELKEESDQETSVSLDTPEQTLLEDGKRYFDRELYQLARENFLALKAAYPTSPFVEFAEIKIADSLFEGGDYTEAAKAYEDFTKQRPAADAIPYMLFRAARSYQLAHRGVGRDPSPLERSRELFDRLISDHPGSIYDTQARAYRSRVIEDLAEHERKIGAFYGKLGFDEARAARSQFFEENWVPVIKTTSFSPPESQPVADGVPVAGVIVAASQKNSGTRSAGGSPHLPSDPDGAARYNHDGETITPHARITKVECAPERSQGAFVFFDKPFPALESFTRPTKVSPTGGIITVSIPGVRSAAQTSSCFSNDDLTLSADGTVTLRANAPATVFSLTNPPRLFIAPAS